MLGILSSLGSRGVSRGQVWSVVTTTYETTAQILLAHNACLQIWARETNGHHKNTRDLQE